MRLMKAKNRKLTDPHSQRDDWHSVIRWAIQLGGSLRARQGECVFARLLRHLTHQTAAQGPRTVIELYDSKGFNLQEENKIYDVTQVGCRGGLS